MSKGKYLDNKILYPIVCEWKKKLKDNPDTPIPNEIGEAIMIVARNLARDRRFQHSYKDEMIDDAIYDCVKYFKNFNEEKYNNVHTYITTLCWNAFVKRINIEADKQAIKYKHYLFNVFETGHLDSGRVDPDFYFDILEKYNKHEQKRERKKQKLQKRKEQKQEESRDTINLENFIDE